MYVCLQQKVRFANNLYCARACVNHLVDSPRSVIANGSSIFSGAESTHFDEIFVTRTLGAVLGRCAELLEVSFIFLKEEKHSN